MQRFHQIPWEQRNGILEQLQDERMRELGRRLIYTERPDALLNHTRADLDAWCDQRLRPNIDVPCATIGGALTETQELLREIIPKIQNCSVNLAYGCRLYPV